MRMLSKSTPRVVLILTVFMVVFTAATSSAGITGGYPGYPKTWEGMTTNTIIRIDLDKPVSLSGGQPDMDYTVKKAAFDGFDFISVEVICDVEVSDDRKTIRLYPQGLLEKDSFYAYKIERIAFEGGTEQNYTQCYATGSNPPQFLNAFVSEADICDDRVASFSEGSWCGRCHGEWEEEFSCVFKPDD